MKKHINPWAQLSIEYASQRSYLDDLFQVYPTIPEGIRELNGELWQDVKKAFKKRDNTTLLKSLFKLKLFPIKDSYVAYLRRDKTALERNPATAARLSGRLYEMGLDSIYIRCSEPKETNRQIGPLFKRWLKKKSLGVEPLELDFIGRFNGKYVIGEAKFLTDFGGHQNAQFNDAIATVKAKGVEAITVAILDGVLYIKGNNKMYKGITSKLKKENIMSALVLREFLYQI